MVLDHPLAQFMVTQRGTSQGFRFTGTVSASGHGHGLYAQTSQNVVHCRCTSTRTKHECTFVAVSEEGLNGPLESPNVGVVSDPSLFRFDQRVDGAQTLGFFGHAVQEGNDGLFVWHRDIEAGKLGVAFEKGREVLNVGQVEGAVVDVHPPLGLEHLTKQLRTLRMRDGVSQQAEDGAGIVAHAFGFIPRDAPQRCNPATTNPPKTASPQAAATSLPSCSGETFSRSHSTRPSLCV